MVDMMNWFLSFFAGAIQTIFSITSADGWSLGYMMLGFTILGLITTSTVGVFTMAVSSTSFKKREPEGLTPKSHRIESR